MDQDKRLHRMIPLPMRLSMQSDCPYIKGQTEQRIAVDISNNPQCHDGLAIAGFRRVENWAYRPACPQCNACTPWRVDVSRFSLSRSMARIMRKNKDLTRIISSPNPKEEHYSLFKSYVTARHNEGQMAQMDQQDFISMISNSPIETVLISYTDCESRLVASILVDIQSDGVSAVYSFFDSTLKSRSLGTFMILDLFSIAKETQLDWVYLGYFVEGSPKMNYKARFEPAEIFQDGKWQVAPTLRVKTIRPSISLDRIDQ